MRCRDAKEKIAAQRDSTREQADTAKLQEHLKQCQVCRSFKERQQSIESLLCSVAPRAQGTLSTDSIMLAIQKQRRITQQLEDIRQQQQTRMERLRSIGAAIAAITLFTVGSIPLILLAVIIAQTDLVVKALAPLNGLLDILFISVQYLQVGLTMVTRDNLLLSGVAFAFVIMMGMWLRLMRYPQEA